MSHRSFEHGDKSGHSRADEGPQGFRHVNGAASELAEGVDGLAQPRLQRGTELDLQGLETGPKERNGALNRVGHDGGHLLAGALGTFEPLGEGVHVAGLGDQHAQRVASAGAGDGEGLGDTDTRRLETQEDLFQAFAPKVDLFERNAEAFQDGLRLRRGVGEAENRHPQARAAHLGLDAHVGQHTQGGRHGGDGQAQTRRDRGNELEALAQHRQVGVGGGRRRRENVDDERGLVRFETEGTE